MCSPRRQSTSRPDGRWTRANSAYELIRTTSSLTSAITSLDRLFDAELRESWSAILRSSEVSKFADRQQELVQSAAGRPLPTRIDPSTFADGVRSLLKIETLRPMVEQELMNELDNAAGSATSDGVRAALILIAAMTLTLVVLWQITSTLSSALAKTRRGLIGLRGGFRNVPSMNLRGPCELASVSGAFRDIVRDLAVVEAQAAAVAEGNLHHPALSEESGMPVSHSLRASVQRLNELARQLQSRGDSQRNPRERRRCHLDHRPGSTNSQCEPGD